MCACCFWCLGRNAIYSVCLHQDIKSGATSMQRRGPTTHPKNHMKGPSGLVLFLRLLFACLPYRQTALFLTSTLSSTFCHPQVSVTKSQSLPLIHHLVPILVHVVNRAFNFRTCLSFLEAGSMSRNCFRGLGAVREKCP